MKYNVGDRVRIKNFDWFRNEGANIAVTFMMKYYGEVVTIKSVHKDFYRIKEDGRQYCWTDEMIECKMEEETKPELKYKVGDKVRIKSIDWYNMNKDEDGDVPCGEYYFVPQMSVFCGKILTIDVDFGDGTYLMKEDIDGFVFTDEMIEGLAEEEVGLVDNLSSRWVNEFNLPEGYIFKDENGNVINATKIVLEKKKKEYPKTYEECEKVLRYDSHRLDNMGVTVRGYKWELIRAFQILLICRDAYWKIAGEEMGLGKPWKPDWNIRGYYAIARSYGIVVKTSNYNCDLTFVFPTEEMRDAFYENFKELINECKELL